MIEMTGRQGRRHKQLLDDLVETRWYWKLKEEAPDRTLWKTRFGRGCGPVTMMTVSKSGFVSFVRRQCKKELILHWALWQSVSIPGPRVRV
jgi:hypothetical protein